MIAKLTPENQVTLPKTALDAVGPVSHFQVQVEDGPLVLTPARPGAGDAVRQKLADLGIAEADVTEAVDWARQYQA